MIQKWYIPLYAKTADRSTAPKQEEACTAPIIAVEKQIKNARGYNTGLIERKRYVQNVVKPLQLKAPQAIFAVKHVL